MGVAARCRGAVALLVHALPAPAAPRRSQRRVLALGKGLMQHDHLRRPPNSRTGQVRASVRSPAPRRPGRNRSVAGPRSLPHPHGRGRRIWRKWLSLLRWRSQYFGRNDCLQSQQQISSSPIRSLLDAAGDVSYLRSQGLVNPAIDVARGWP